MLNQFLSHTRSCVKFTARQLWLKVTFFTTGLGCIVFSFSPAWASDETVFLGHMQPPSEQAVGQGYSAQWALPLIATQYQPAISDGRLRQVMQLQSEGRFLEALIVLDEGEASTESSLLRASVMLQAHQSQQALEVLAPLLQAEDASAAYALTAMAQLKLGHIQEALDAAQQGRKSGAGSLSVLALTYALQGAGQLDAAYEEIHHFNQQSATAVTLAREAELALTLNRINLAQSLIEQARMQDVDHPYVVAVSGFSWLIEGRADKAEAAFKVALLRDSNDAKALLGLGLSMVRLGKLEQGYRTLLAAHQADSENALILTYLGRVQQKMGKSEAARHSWRQAQNADPLDPAPWLYQAQQEIRSNQLLEARQSLRQAQARTEYRSVYRSQGLLQEDEQLLQANLAEIQRRLGLASLAFRTLADAGVGNNTMVLRNQADLLEGERFAESARRSLVLQSLFDEEPGNLPATLDIYGDGSGQIGTSMLQHGVVNGLNAPRSSYNDYDKLFSQLARLEFDIDAANRNGGGAQVRAGVGNELLGFSVAARRYQFDGYSQYEELDNTVGAAMVQWRPRRETQVFGIYQTFDSRRGEVFYPADVLIGSNAEIEDRSRLSRMGLRQSLSDNTQLYAMWSAQHTNQDVHYSNFFLPVFSFTQASQSDSRSAELKFSHSYAEGENQLGAMWTSGNVKYLSTGSSTNFDLRQFYAAWKSHLGPHWYLDAQIGWGDVIRRDQFTAQERARITQWLPKLGLVYRPNEAAQMRFSAWKNLGGLGVGGASLAPVSLAGILLSRPTDDGKLIHAVAMGLDYQWAPAWRLSFEGERRSAEQPSILRNQQVMLSQQMKHTKVAVSWLAPGGGYALHLSSEYEYQKNDERVLALDSLDAQGLHAHQLMMQWFPSAAWNVRLTWSHNRVAGSRQSRNPFFVPMLEPYQSQFNLLGAETSWALRASQVMLIAGVRNATNVAFKYVDTDPLNQRFSKGRLLYGRLKWAF